MTHVHRLPHAPTELPAELAEFLAPFHIPFARPEPRHTLGRYLTGLLADHPNKNGDTPAAVVPGTTGPRLQGPLTDMRWDEDALNRHRGERMLAPETEGDGVPIFDDTGFPKPGTAPVGVARRYSGTLGTTGNGQGAVHGHSAERTLAWPVATRLYLPKPWAGDAVRRARARAGCGPGSTGTRWRSCRRTRSWCGRSTGSGGPAPVPAACGRLFPPRPDRRRVPLPEVHRQVRNGLRLRALREWAARDDIAWFLPLRN